MISSIESTIFSDLSSIASPTLSDLQHMRISVICTNIYRVYDVSILHLRLTPRRSITAFNTPWMPTLLYVYFEELTSSGTSFTKGFALVIQFPIIFHFTIIQMLMNSILQICAHNITGMLLQHWQKCSQRYRRRHKWELQWTKYISDFNDGGKWVSGLDPRLGCWIIRWTIPKVVICLYIPLHQSWRELCRLGNVKCMGLVGFQFLLHRVIYKYSFIGCAVHWQSICSNVPMPSIFTVCLTLSHRSLNASFQRICQP